MLTGFILMMGVGAVAIALTSLLTYEILGYVWNLLPCLTGSRRLRVLAVILPIFIIHILNIWLYAGLYFLVENITSLGVLAGSVGVAAFTFESFIERLYFSATTYTSLGLGDVAPLRDLRMLVGAEVLNGLVLIGWTISFTYLTMEKFWALPGNRKESNQ